jgi:hypothetical protein
LHIAENVNVEKFEGEYSRRKVKKKYFWEMVLNRVAFICLLVSCFGLNAWGQNKKNQGGKVSWHVPAEVMQLEKSTRRPSLQSGYRIQIFLGSLEEAKKFRQNYILQHPNAMIYISQNIPDYVLRYGNFLSKNEARVALKEIRKEIPSSIIVDDMVEPPRIDLNDKK